MTWVWFLGTKWSHERSKPCGSFAHAYWHACPHIQWIHSNAHWMWRVISRAPLTQGRNPFWIFLSHHSLHEICKNFISNSATIGGDASVLPLLKWHTIQSSKRKFTECRLGTNHWTKRIILLISGADKIPVVKTHLLIFHSGNNCCKKFIR